MELYSRVGNILRLLRHGINSPPHIIPSECESMLGFLPSSPIQIGMLQTCEADAIEAGQRWITDGEGVRDLGKFLGELKSESEWACGYSYIQSHDCLSVALTENFPRFQAPRDVLSRSQAPFWVTKVHSCSHVEIRSKKAF